MGDGTQTYLFSFGPLSGLANIASGQPGSLPPSQFNTPNDPKANLLQPGDPATSVAPVTAQSVPPLTSAQMSQLAGFYNGAVGLDYDVANTVSIYDISETGNTVTVGTNIASSFTYYYLAPDAGTYFWHCHIPPPEHLQMGMVGQIYVRPRQNRVPVGTSLYTARTAQNGDLRTACVSATDILCSNPLPVVNTAVNRAASGNYAYNDGDGSTYYDVEYPIQMHGFDPNFHFVGMTFNPEGFADMKDKYFLLNGRSYPDTVDVDGNWDKSYGTSATPALYTQVSDGTNHPSQPLPTFIQLKQGERALLRISDLDVTEFQTLASVGIPMQVIALNARLLRDEAGNNMYYNTNSITLGGGESLDVILDTCTGRGPAPDYACTTKMPAGKYFLYTPQLDHLSNDAENFGGLMTEVDVTN